MTQRRRTGELGEDVARRHLEANGYSVLDVNVRVGRHEIDLIAEQDGQLVFVEVRAKRTGRMGTPEESISQKKRSHLVAAAEQYLQANDGSGRDWRIDVVAVELDARGVVTRVEVTENAVEV